MKSWLGFGISLVVALSVHAVILLVPRVAGRGEAVAQTIEVSLESESAGPGAGDPRPVVVPKRRAEPARPAGPAAAPAPPAAAMAEPAPSPVPPGAASDKPPADNALGSAPPPEAIPGEGSVASAAPGGSGAEAAASVFTPGGGSGMAVSSGGAAQGNGSAGGAASKPRPRGEIQPGYPPRARRAGWEGVATIRAFIDETGRVVSAKVLVSSGHPSLDQAALEAVKSWVFFPALRGGKAVSSPVDQPIRFTLR